MSNPHHGDAKRTRGDKLDHMVGKRGEYPPDRAARIVGANPADGQGDSVKPTEEVFVGAPARQISNYGTVKGA